MSTNSRYFGIVITMNYSDHPPPHFHVRYGEHRALVSIDGLLVLHGELPPRVLGLVVGWHNIDLSCGQTGNWRALNSRWRRLRHRSRR